MKHKEVIKLTAKVSSIGLLSLLLTCLIKNTANVILHLQPGAAACVKPQTGCDARKPVFGSLGTTKAQTCLRIRAV